MFFLLETLASYAVTETLSFAFSSFPSDLDLKIKNAIISALNETLRIMPRGNSEELLRDVEKTLILGKNIKTTLAEINPKFEKFLDKDSYQCWVDCFNDNCIREFSRDEQLSNYMLLAITCENKEKEKRIIKEYQELIQIFIDDINANRKENIYDGLRFVMRTVDPFIANRLRPSVVPSPYIIELAYGLSDIYDKTNQGAKLEELVNRLLSVLDNVRCPLDKNRLQKIIGLFYSLIQVERDNIKEKKEDLKKVEKKYESLRETLNRFYESAESEQDCLFIKGLYESNYGALCLKKYDVYGDIAYIREAEKHHLEALKYREKLFSAIKDLRNNPDVIEAERRVFQSKNNLASVYFRMRDYSKALQLHKEVLEYRQRNNLVYDIHLSKRYIAGCLIEGWKKKGHISLEEINMIKEYLNDCIIYYSANESLSENGNQIRKEDSEKCLKTVENLEKQRNRVKES